MPGWETFARRLMDSERLELFLSGSSARLLSREVATSMRGRAMEALVFPFSFREFLRHHNVKDAPPGVSLHWAAGWLLQTWVDALERANRRERYDAVTRPL